MRTHILAAMIAASVLLAGCDKVDLPFLPKSDAQLLLGKWSCTSDEKHGLSNLTLDFAKDGKAKMNLKGEANEGIVALGVDIDVDLAYTLAARKLAFEATGGKVNRLTVNGEAIDVAAMGGADAIEKKMTADMKMSDSTITALDAHQLMLKPANDAAITCKR